VLTTASSGALPSGTVTFLFATAETAARLAEEQPDTYAELFHFFEIAFSEAVRAHDGVIFEGVGDSLYAAFPSAPRAVAAALDSQRRVVSFASTTAGRLRVRMGLNTGDAEPHGRHYVGAPLYRCARIMAVAHPSQVLLSSTTAAGAVEALPEGASLRSVGTHRLKDLAEPEVISQLRHPDLPSEFPPLKSLSVLLNNLPSQLTSFVGRQEEIAEVGRHLGSSRLLTLLGPGGVGKTRLSLQVAADAIDTYRDGVWLVEFAALVDPRLVTQQVAAALGVREEVGRPLVDTLLQFTRSKQLLLLLDNCEHLRDACAENAAQLLGASPEVRILATSQQKLGLPDETVWTVPPLRVPDLKADTAGQLGRFESVRLFVDRASSVQASFRINDRNGGAIAQICRQLDGIPLAIELAAARVNVLSVDQLASRLQDRFHVLTRGSRTALPRQQTLRAVIDWSYGLLNADEGTLFRRLAVFSGGWSADAAPAVCAWNDLSQADIGQLLTGLADKSLTVSERTRDDMRRHRMLESLRAYAWERLSESGEAEQSRRRHADFFLALTEKAEPELTGPQQRTWLETLDAEHDNVRAALRWSETSSESDLGWRIGGAMWRYWSVRGLFSEGRARLAALLSRTHERSAAQAKALHGAGVLATQTGDYAGARAAYEESLAIRREIGDRAGAANTLSNLGIVARWLDDLSSARELYEESLAIRRELDDKWGIATSLNLLGLLTHYQSDYPTARRLLEESLAIRRVLGDKWTIGNSLNNLGLVVLDQGDLIVARSLYEESLAVYRELGDRWAIAFLLEAFAGLAAADDLPERALVTAGAAEALREAIGSPLSPADRGTLKRRLEPARLALTGDQQAECWSRGRAMTLEQAIAYVAER
jgi:predicted ATPase/class 3 adenylate cyclase